MDKFKYYVRHHPLLMYLIPVIVMITLTMAMWGAVLFDSSCKWNHGICPNCGGQIEMTDQITGNYHLYRCENKDFHFWSPLILDNN